jgi:hypothetical protein
VHKQEASPGIGHKGYRAKPVARSDPVEHVPLCKKVGSRPCKLGIPPVWVLAATLVYRKFSLKSLIPRIVS